MRNSHLLTSSGTRTLIQRLESEMTAGAIRQISPKYFLKQLQERIVPRIGIARVAEIGHFVGSGVHVFQTTRPRLYCNFRSGMNTGSQGKGLTREQGMISAIMESLEAYALEPREYRPLFAKSRDLSQNYLVFTPDEFDAPAGPTKFSPDQELVWARTLVWPDRVEAFIPAELVYFLFPNHYGTPAYFPTTSNGVGAHSTYLGAVMQALYELIERFYIFHLERMQVTVEAFVLEDREVLRLLANCSDEFLDNVDVQLYSIKVDGLKEQMPFIYCVLCDELRMTVGYGMHLEPSRAIERAFTEAAQCWATEVSSAREDLAQTEQLFVVDEDVHKLHWPEFRTLKFSSWAKRFRAKSQTGLASDFKFVTGWLERLNCRKILISDLTPAGISCPVVRVVVPGLESANKYSRVPAGNMADIPGLKRFSVYV